MCSVLRAVYASRSDGENRLRVREFLEEECVLSTEGLVRDWGLCDVL